MNILAMKAADAVQAMKAILITLSLADRRAALLAVGQWQEEQERDAEARWAPFLDPVRIASLHPDNWTRPPPLPPPAPIPTNVAAPKQRAKKPRKKK